MFLKKYWLTNNKSNHSSMKKLAFVMVVTLITFGSVHAQPKEMANAKSLALNFGTNFGLPVGETTTSTIKYVFGGDLQAVYHTSSKFNLTGSAGFDIWHHDKGVNFNYVPLLAGFRYYLSGKTYLSEQAGYAIGVSKDAETKTRMKGAFTNIAGIGLITGANSDLLLGYKGLFYSGATLSIINLRLSYRLGK